jgi:hypothetical protein
LREDFTPTGHRSSSEKMEIVPGLCENELYKHIPGCGNLHRKIQLELTPAYSHKNMALLCGVLRHVCKV